MPLPEIERHRVDKILGAFCDERIDWSLPLRFYERNGEPVRSG